MEKPYKRLMAMLLPLLSLALTSCSDNDEPNDSPSSVSDKVSAQTETAISNTFPDMRLDSIQSHKEYGNIKLTYRNNLLLTYNELYDNGKIHDGVDIKLYWTLDTVFITCGSNRYKGVFGTNGCVEKLICPNGLTNTYEYEDGYLIKYHYDIVSHEDDEYIQLTWENGNVTEERRYFRYDYSSDPKLYYVDYFFKYDSNRNIAGLLPPLRSYCWINDTGRSFGYGINEALYFAGVLGKGTRNLPVSSQNRYHDGQQNHSYSFEYSFNELGYVTTASEGENTDHYFYTK